MSIRHAPQKLACFNATGLPAVLAATHTPISKITTIDVGPQLEAAANNDTLNSSPYRSLKMKYIHSQQELPIPKDGAWERSRMGPQQLTFGMQSRYTSRRESSRSRAREVWQLTFPSSEKRGAEGHGESRSCGLAHYGFGSARSRAYNSVRNDKDIFG